MTLRQRVSGDRDAGSSDQLIDCFCLHLTPAGDSAVTSRRQQADGDGGQHDDPGDVGLAGKLFLADFGRLHT